MKQILVILILCLPAASLAMADDWADRGTPEGCRKLCDAAAARCRDKPTYDMAWKYARALLYQADYFIAGNQPETRKTSYQKATEAARAAVRLNADGVEGHYYLAVSLGSWATANGIMDSLAAAGEILKETTWVIEHQPAFLDGSAYMVRGRLYHLAPGFPVSVGDMKKAGEDFRKVAGEWPSNRTAMRFYADYLVSLKKMAEARVLINKAIGIPFDHSNLPGEYTELWQLIELKAVAEK